MVGVTGGITMANQYGTKGGALIKDDQKIGYTLGLIMETPIAKSNFSFQPGIFYTQKGRIENVSFKEKRHWSLRYAELQANVLYNLKCDKGGTFLQGVVQLYLLIFPHLLKLAYWIPILLHLPVMIL